MRPASPKYDERSFFFTTPAPARGARIERSPRPVTSGSTGRAPRHPGAPSAADAVGFATPAPRQPGAVLGKRGALDAGTAPQSLQAHTAISAWRMQESGMCTL